MGRLKEGAAAMRLSDLFLFQLHLECFLKMDFTRNRLRGEVFKGSVFERVFPLG